ncbi:DUF6483 family protein [Paenibacillus hexagrammi]|uniref:DUF6483 family protein n=1 Tax=Paenibacillus hexagrammi TaxID=2908839 RepID=A0ABY3SDH6_9BACL|nr:DUF6483 family protein [Paenibacillus sp. YPD9-1]UJF32047.1 DUF6483 family protein [Paenibacillus sp. YPD9-1]
MFRRDYFMRQIEQLTVTLHRILFHKDQLQIAEAQRLLEEASRHVLGLNVHSLYALSSKDILEFLTYQGSLDSGKALIVADLFREQGDLYVTSGEPEEAYAYHLKSLELLFELYNLDDEDQTEIRQESCPRIEAVIERLSGWFIPAPIKLSLFAFYESRGRYSKAEDVLFHYIEDAGEKESVLQEAIMFYKRLLAKDEKDLQAGNFTAEEAVTGLEQLKQKYHAEENPSV